ncbi:MAG: hypothetical protein [Circular genetic element sp.]|nr:MAG: hypothetical protein [Circular genetic element sp.]
MQYFIEPIGVTFKQMKANMCALQDVTHSLVLSIAIHFSLASLAYAFYNCPTRCPLFSRHSFHPPSIVLLESIPNATRTVPSHQAM